MFSPESLLRTQLSMRDDATRMKLSPLLRVSTLVPQTQSAVFNPSRNFGMSRGSFCKSASSVKLNFPCEDCIPAQLAADSPQLNLNRCARTRGSAAAISLRIVHDLSELQSSVITTS